jgi:molecular chaperone DnaJ
MPVDHYETLGVSRDASPDEIKRAYRRLARAHHPDANRHDADAEERFKRITHAYDVLSDPDKRQRYDMFGDERGQGGFGGFGGFTDIFDAFFTGMSGTRRAGPARGSDVLAEVGLTLEEAASGVEREVELSRLGECDECAGSGARPGTVPQRCRECGGTGEVRQVRRTMLGNMMTASPCARCGGSGREILEPCPRCHGQGRVNVSETITVHIPAGIEDGAHLKVSGRGEAGVRGGRTGDLYVSVRVLPHEVFKRVGDDLGCEVSVPMTVAALGGAIKVPTLDGERDLEVDPGTQAGDVARLKGAGMPRLDGRGRGELVILLRVETPRRLDDEQRDVLRQLARLRGEEPVEPSGLFDRIREAFQ